MTAPKNRSRWFISSILKMEIRCLAQESLPRAIADSEDDPFRSLIYMLIDAGVLEELTLPPSASSARRSITARNLRKPD